MAASVQLELFVDGRWQHVAELEALEETRGYEGRSRFSYDDTYVFEHLGRVDHRAASCVYPVNFALQTQPTWPAFILDILPSGAGRRALLQSLGLTDSREVDWELLRHGAVHPPGNLRVASAVRSHEPTPGFTRNDVVTRSEEFVAVMAEVGSIVAGASVGGEAPKFLLTEDQQGRFHPDGALNDADARRHWLVKYPRNKRESDRVVLRCEAAYHRVATAFGVLTEGTLEYERDTLFVPRFDRRVTRDGIERSGVESLCSLAQVPAYGTYVSHQKQCAALGAVVDDAASAIAEYVKRDVLNLALGNTDNHARNTSVRKTPDGKVAIAPLYDFAPMFLDEDLIPRASKWDGLERLSIPDWPKVVEALPLEHDGRRAVSSEVVRLIPSVRRLPETMRASGVDDDVIERRVGRITELARALDELLPVAKRTKVES